MSIERNQWFEMDSKHFELWYDLCRAEDDFIDMILYTLLRSIHALRHPSLQERNKVTLWNKKERARISILLSPSSRLSL